MLMRKRQRTYVRAKSWASPNHITVNRNNAGDVVSSFSQTQSPVILEFNREYCEDVDRKAHPYRESNRDNGGPFFLKRVSAIVTELPFAYSGELRNSATNRVSCEISGLTLSNQRRLWFTSTADQAWSSVGSTNTAAALAAYGASAFNAIDPTVGVLPSASQFLAELIKDGIPALPGRLLARLKTFRGAGSEYLNYQFGWKILLTDIEKMLQKYLELDLIIAQLKRDNLRQVRRSKTLSNISYSTRSSVSIGSYEWPGWTSTSPFGAGPSSNPSYPALNNYGTMEESSFDRIWVTGRGRYVLDHDIRYPKGPTDIASILKLFTQEPTPVTVYNVIPWTWLIDWFSNLGDLVQQASGSGIGTFTADYCYLMRHQSKRTKYSYLNTPRFAPSYALNNVGNYVVQGGRSMPVYRPLDYILVEESKRRIAASPFGFGLTVGALTPQQLAILTALGLSRQNFI